MGPCSLCRSPERQRLRLAAPALLAFAAFLAMSGCARLKALGARKEPFEAYVKGEYRPPTGGPVVTPPEGALRPWRVLAMQVEPRQKKNPHYVAIAIDAAGELEMPPGSAFRCLYNPGQFRAVADEMMTGVSEWDVIRDIRCSSDGWKTYAAAGLRVVYDAAGHIRRRSTDQVQLDLHEPFGKGESTLSVFLRAD